MNTGASGCLWKKNADNEVAQSRDVQFHCIDKDGSIGRNRDGWLTAKGKNAVGTRDDIGSAGMQRNVNGAYLNGVLSIRIREPNPRRVAAKACVHDLAQRLLFKLQVCGPHLRFIGKLRSWTRFPGAY